MVAGRPEGRANLYLTWAYNSVRLWALCTPLSPSSAYAPLSPARPFPPRTRFFSSSRLRPRDRVISGRNVRLSWVLIFFFLRDA